MTTAPRKDSDAIRGMFSSISGTYDLLNHTLSGGLDCAWRRRAIARTEPCERARILDLGTGTGDLALGFAKRRGFDGQVVGLDFVSEMLVRAKRKANGSGTLCFVQGDALRLPFRSASFDVASAAFSIRNVADLDRALSEVRRVLRPGGSFVVLEFFRPERLAWPLRYYLRTLLPLLGAGISRHASAYAYLRDSQESFLTQSDAENVFEAGGFELRRSERLFPGFAHLLLLEKPGELDERSLARPRSLADRRRFAPAAPGTT